MTALCSVALVVVAACSLTTSLDGFSAGAAEDGGGGAGDAIAPGAKSESGVPGEGGGGGGGSSFCATVPSSVFLCADFDDGRIPPLLEEHTRSTSSIEVVGDDFRSSPFAALLTTLPSESMPGAAFETRVPGRRQHFVVDFDVKVDAYGGSSDWDLLNFGLDTPQVGVQLKSDGALVFDEDLASPDVTGRTSIETRVGRSLSKGWSHLRWTLDVVGGELVTKLELDAAVVAEKTFRAEPVTAAEPTVVELGDPGQTSLSAAWRVRIDNVVIDAH